MGNLSPFMSGHVQPRDSKGTPEEQLRQAIESAGLPPPASIHVDGQIHRFATSSKPDDDSGWYVIYSGDVPAGAFGDWRSGVNQKFVADIGRKLTPVEEMQNAQRIADAKRRNEEDRRIRNERAADTCQEIWDGAMGAGPDHPYLKRKGISPHLARLASDGRLIVPLFDADGNLSTLQYIDADGDKKYHPGGKAKAGLCQIGAFPLPGDVKASGKIYIAEGYATSATIYEATGMACIAAYSAGNLESVAMIVRNRFPSAEIVIVADNDKFDERQKIYPGRHFADLAAAVSGATVVMPPGDPGSGDANDYRANGGDLIALLTPSLDMVSKLKAIFGDELGDEYEAPDEVVQGLVVARALTVIYGDSNSGKTFFALSLGCAVSEGVSCYSRMTDGGLVIYLATEAPGSIRARMQALKRFHQVKLSRLVMVPVPLNFYSNAGDAMDVIRLVDQVSRARNAPVRMIIADTLARMSAGANENSGEDMGPVMDRFALVAEHTGASVVIIHHSGKDQAKGARGWSGIRAHIDTEIEVEESDGTRFAKVTKQRELASKGDEIAFELQVVQMGMSKFGAEVTTCVAVPSEGEKRVKIDKATRDRHRILKAAFEFSGMDKLDGYPYITRSSLVQYLVEKEGRSPDSARRAATEAPDRLIGFLTVAGTIQAKGNGWIVTDPEMASVMNILASARAKNQQPGNAEIQVGTNAGAEAKTE